MADYGVQPSGFVRKPMAVILAEIENSMVDAFGAEVIQTADSPLGNLNAVYALARDEIEKVFLDVYQSFDVDVAEGTRLDIVSNLRYLVRADGETDTAFRPRITNQKRANIKLADNVQFLRGLPGVTWAAAKENRTNEVDENGLPPHSVAYAVIGGDDEIVAGAIFALSVPGITMIGSTNVEVIHMDYCQPTIFIRPIDVPVRVEMIVKHVPDPSGCAPPTIGTITDFIIDALSDEYTNGDDVVKERVEVEIARIGNLKITSLKIARQSDVVEEDEVLPMGIFERPVFVSPYIIVSYAPPEE